VEINYFHTPAVESLRRAPADTNRERWGVDKGEVMG